MRIAHTISVLFEQFSFRTGLFLSLYTGLYRRLRSSAKPAVCFTQLSGESFASFPNAAHGALRGVPAEGAGEIAACAAIEARGRLPPISPKNHASFIAGFPSFGLINSGSVALRTPGIIVMARKLDVNMTIATSTPM